MTVKDNDLQDDLDLNQQTNEENDEEITNEEEDDEEENYEEESKEELLKRLDALKKQNQKLKLKKQKAIQKRMSESPINIEEQVRLAQKKIMEEQEVINSNPKANLEVVSAYAEKKGISLIEASEKIYGGFVVGGSPKRNEQDKQAEMQAKLDSKRKKIFGI